MENQFISTKLNLDQHYSLLGEQDLVYLLNGDIQGDEGNVDGFVQNTPSNELCIDTNGYTLVGPGISIGTYERVLFLKGDTSEIWKANLDECSYTVWATGDCLAFDPDYPVRGVYKHNNKDNDRRVYFVDGLNYNRYIDIDKPFPESFTGSFCDTCELTYDGTLNCDNIRINKMFDYPCLTLGSAPIGSLSSGVYQVALAFSENGIKYSDFFFSDVIKVHSTSDNIGLTMSIDCMDTPFDQVKVLLVSNTQESALVVYEIGDFSSNTKSININNLTNATILSTQEALEKRVVYDKSQHITSNSETLLLGKHAPVEPLNYQPQANEIGLYWTEGKVPKKNAHMFLSLLRDEVGSFAIEWFDEVGQSRGVFHIPGNVNNDFTIEFDGNTYGPNDYVPSEAYIYEEENCEPLRRKVWQIENTATLLEDFSGDCEICEDIPQLNKYGKMGYYECESLTYPDDEVWGDLRCQPIRHHRLPSSNLTHIHNQAECFTSIQIIEQYDEEGNSIGTVEDYSVDYIEDDCINILGVMPTNVPYPKDSQGADITNWKYRILYASRLGNKSIAHKGLIFNTFQEIAGAGADQQVIYYPNYPYNDLKADVFISKTQTGHQTDPEVFTPNNNISSREFTYHSPDIHFRETKNEFGIEVKLYTEEIGVIQGDFNYVYQHPQVAIAASSPNLKTFYKHARQLDSVCNYSNYEVVSLPFQDRRLIETSQYLLPIRQVVNGNIKFNNFQREDSFFLGLRQTDPSFPNPTTPDTSRVRVSDIGCALSFNNCARLTRNSIDYDIQGVSYYVGIKNPQSNQYGSLEQINYIPMEHCLRQTDGSADLDITNLWWGGDTYITKHRIERKMPLFTEWLDNVPFDEAEYNYRDVPNVLYPRYWFDNLSQVNDQYRFNCAGGSSGSSAGVSGTFYLWINGVLDFWCESEFIGDYREEDQTPNSRFYPTTPIKDLFRSDTIRLQPTFLYDFSLLATDIVIRKQILNLTQSDADFTTIYSLKEDSQSAADNWLKFLPLNYTILPRIYGEFTGLHYTDQYSILFAFENQMLYSQEDYTQTTNEGNTIFLSQGDIFSRRLRKMSNEVTGYTGCVDPYSFVNTRYGTLYFDRYRKTWFMWSGQLQPIESNSKWFDQFTDNGNPGYKDSIITVFDNNSKNVYMTDKIKGWTLSYKPELKGFVSFHSFIPDWYMFLPNDFISTPSGISTGIWKHDKEFDYQTYYEQTYPFDIGFVLKGIDQTLQSFEIFSDWIRYAEWGAPKYIKDKFFDTLLVYNDRTSTGIIPLQLKNDNDPNQSLIQNKDQYIAEVTQVLSNIYRVNKLEDTQVDSPNIQILPNGWEYTTLNLGVKNPYDRGGLRGRWFIVHLSSTQNTHKIIAQLNSTKSIQNFK